MESVLYEWDIETHMFLGFFLNIWCITENTTPQILAVNNGKEV